MRMQGIVSVVTPAIYVVPFELIHQIVGCHQPVLPKVCSVNPKGSATSSQGIRVYVSVMAALKLTYFLTKGIVFC
jgi:hypothetical protein